MRRRDRAMLLLPVLKVGLARRRRGFAGESSVAPSQQIASRAAAAAVKNRSDDDGDGLDK